MMTLTTFIVIALTLQNNPNVTTNSLSSAKVATQPSNALQLYKEQNTNSYQQKNLKICQQLVDNIDLDVEYLEPLPRPLPNDFVTSSIYSNLQANLKKFNEKGCAFNQYLNRTDRDLTNKLYQDMTK